MKIVGLITEYNPFHNGHKYHIQQALEQTASDAAVVVMSGDFVQRGTPSVMPKTLRVRAALLSGASAVFELPLIYACSSAEYFADGAVSLLHSLGCVDCICFGGECDNIDILRSIAAILAEEPAEYRIRLQEYIKQGYSYPVSRKLALDAYTGSTEYGEILDSPNNILGIEYIKAAIKLHSEIDFHVLKRISSSYHDTDLKEQFSSATSIRAVLENRDSFPEDMLTNQIPANCLEIMNQHFRSDYPVCVDDFSLLLHYRLLTETAETLITYADVSMDLANRIIKNRNKFIGWNQFCDLLKTKEVTYSRISRCLLHILLDIRKTDYTDGMQKVSYARLLGFSAAQKDILSEIKKNSMIPVISRAGDLSCLDDRAKTLYSKEINAANIYQAVLSNKFSQPFLHEFQKKIVII